MTDSNVADSADNSAELTDLHVRRPLNGPVIADLAEATSPGIAALDSRWAAAVLAGGARDAAELRDWLCWISAGYNIRPAQPPVGR